MLNKRKSTSFTKTYCEAYTGIIWTRHKDSKIAILNTVLYEDLTKGSILPKSKHSVRYQQGMASTKLKFLN